MLFLKGNSSDLTIHVLLFIAKINIIVCYRYNKYGRLATKARKQKCDEVWNLIRTNSRLGWYY